MLRKVLKEPLVHFLALALVIFAAYGALSKSDTARPDQIVVTQARIEQIAGLFARTWQRPPTAPELKGLVDDYVKEEVYYREAIALGLENDDTVIRRRLRQKIEFLSDAEIETLDPADTELEQYLKANPSKFRIDPAIAFRQIYLNPERRSGKANADAASILEALRSNPSLDPASFGDTTLLPSELSLSSPASIAQTFGTEFAEEIVKATPEIWLGPLKSEFGLHIVRVSEMKPGRTPKLEEVHDTVAREWSNDTRKALADQRFAELLKRYKITFESAPKIGPQAAATP